MPTSDGDGSVKKWARNVASYLFKKEKPAESGTWFNPENVTEQKREWIESQQQQPKIMLWPEHMYESLFIVGMPPDVEVTEIAERLCDQERRVRHEPGRPDSALDKELLDHEHPPEPAYQPQVIYRYPEDKAAPLSDREITDLCFPHQVAPEKLRRTHSMSALNEVIFGAADDEDSQSFVFMLKVAGNFPLYGVCCYVKEMLHRPPYLAKHCYENCKAPFRQCMIAAPRCYCLLTHYPFFELHFQIMHIVLGLERLDRTLEFESERVFPFEMPRQQSQPHAQGQQQQQQQRVQQQLRKPVTLKRYCADCAAIMHDMMPYTPGNAPHAVREQEQSTARPQVPAASPSTELQPHPLQQQGGDAARAGSHPSPIPSTAYSPPAARQQHRSHQESPFDAASRAVSPPPQLDAVTAADFGSNATASGGSSTGTNCPRPPQGLSHPEHRCEVCGKPMPAEGYSGPPIHRGSSTQFQQSLRLDLSQLPAVHLGPSPGPQPPIILGGVAREVAEESAGAAAAHQAVGSTAASLAVAMSRQEPSAWRSMVTAIQAAGKQLLTEDGSTVPPGVTVDTAIHEGDATAASLQVSMVQRMWELWSPKLPESTQKQSGIQALFNKRHATAKTLSPQSVGSSTGQATAKTARSSPVSDGVVAAALSGLLPASKLSPAVAPVTAVAAVTGTVCPPVAASLQQSGGGDGGQHANKRVLALPMSTAAAAADEPGLQAAPPQAGVQSTSSFAPLELQQQPQMQRPPDTVTGAPTAADVTGDATSALTTSRGDGGAESSSPCNAAQQLAPGAAVLTLQPSGHSASDPGVGNGSPRLAGWRRTPSRMSRKLMVPDPEPSTAGSATASRNGGGAAADVHFAATSPARSLSPYTPSSRLTPVKTVSPNIASRPQFNVHAGESPVLGFGHGQEADQAEQQAEEQERDRAQLSYDDAAGTVPMRLSAPEQLESGAGCSTSGGEPPRLQQHGSETVPHHLRNCSDVSYHSAVEWDAGPEELQPPRDDDDSPISYSRQLGGGIKRRCSADYVGLGSIAETPSRRGSSTLSSNGGSRRQTEGSLAAMSSAATLRRISASFLRRSTSGRRFLSDDSGHVVLDNRTGGGNSPGELVMSLNSGELFTAGSDGGDTGGSPRLKPGALGAPYLRHPDSPFASTYAATFNAGGANGVLEEPRVAAVLPAHMQPVPSAPSATDSLVTRTAASFVQYSSSSILERYYHSRVMDPGEVYHLSIGDLYRVENYRPLPLGRFAVAGAAKDVLGFADAELAENLQLWTLASACRSLSLDNLLTMLNAALLEKQLVVFCPNISVLSAVVLSLIPIMRPFAWQSLLLPVTPLSMLPFLEAPVPFVLGVQYKTADVASKCSGLIRVNVYKNIIKNASFPQLPQLKQLMAALQPCYDQLRSYADLARGRPQHILSSEEQEAAQAFMNVLTHYMRNLLGDLRLHTITNVGMEKKTGFLMKEALVDSFAARDRPFYRMFAETQMFAVHSDAVISAYCDR